MAKARTNPWDNAKSQAKYTQPRRLAGRVLRRVLTKQGSARDQLDWSFQNSPPHPKDVGLVTELVYGTVRHLQTLDFVLSHLSSRSLDQIDEGVLVQLRLAAYQWLYLDKIPPHAIVHEAVELIPHRGAKKFANGMLRSLGRLIEKDVEAQGDASRQRFLPVKEGKGWLMTEDVFPQEDASWLAAVYGLPKEYVITLVKRFEFDQAQQLCQCSNSVPFVSLRTNTARIQRDELLEKMVNSGFQAEAGAEPQAIRVRHGAVDKLPGYNKGLFAVQDETAMRVAPFLDPQEGDVVLDLCAAPGGKTMHIAEWMGSEGRIVATDIDPDRLPKIITNRERLGHSFVEVIPRDKVVEEPCFDRVLLDVPCSNTGVLRRRVELRHRLCELDRVGLKKVQADLLREGLGFLKESGTLVYSTCSIDDEENGDLVRMVLSEKAFEGWVLESESLVLPSNNNDGGYVARIRWEKK
jgi:16S rRNA (cytosine967-C5)-methyltransferase